MNLNGLTVVVVGSGTAGAVTALLTARAGARVTLLEKFDDPRSVGAGLGLAENGLAVLDAIGLLPKLAPYLRWVSAPRIVDGCGRVLLEPPLGASGVGMIRRSMLQRVLLEAVGAEPNIRMVFGSEVASANSNGFVVTQGSLARRYDADLVVGADGVHSCVRDAGNFAARVRVGGPLYVRALVSPGVAQEQEAWTRAGLFGSVSLPDATYIYASAASGRTQMVEE